MAAVSRRFRNSFPRLTWARQPHLVRLTASSRRLRFFQRSIVSRLPATAHTFHGRTHSKFGGCTDGAFAYAVAGLPLNDRWRARILTNRDDERNEVLQRVTNAFESVLQLRTHEFE